MRTFQIPITLSDEEIKILKKFKLGVPKDWDELGESEIDYFGLTSGSFGKLQHWAVVAKSDSCNLLVRIQPRFL